MVPRMSLSSDKFQDGNFGSRELKSEGRVGQNGPEIKSNNLGLKMVSLQIGTSNADRIAESCRRWLSPQPMAGRRRGLPAAQELGHGIALVRASRCAWCCWCGLRPCWLAPPP